jgi:hypothetical protein
MSLDTPVTILIVYMLEDSDSVPGIGNVFVFGITSRTTMGPPSLVCNSLRLLFLQG